jgi:hypothetical protein
MTPRLAEILAAMAAAVLDAEAKPPDRGSMRRPAPRLREVHPRDRGRQPRRNPR